MNKLFLITVLVLFLNSCTAEGETTPLTTGSESGLPDELKGLRIYSVGDGTASGVKVGYLPGHTITSTTYKEGKTMETMLLVQPNKARNIEISDILMENDSIIVARKK